MSINEHRLFGINNKVFSINNIRELALLLYKEYEIEKNSELAIISFSVKCSDKSSFESEDISLFESGGILQKKRVDSITLSFQKGRMKLIKIYLEHGSRENNNKYTNPSDIEIGGNDSFWVSGITDKINLLIDSYPEQERVYFQYEYIFDWAYFLIGGFGLVALIEFINKGDKDYTSYFRKSFNTYNDFFGFLVTFSIVGAISWSICSISMTKKVYSLWPLVELQLGPEHLQTEKRKREFLRKIGTLILLPIVLEILFWFIIPK
jgi:hypothetical protein